MRLSTVRWGIGMMGMGLLSLAGQVSANCDVEGVDYVLCPRPLSFPGAVAVDKDDHNLLYVEHPSEDMISKVNLATGEVVGTIANEDDPDTEQLITPDDLWRDPKTGDLYVTEVLVNGVVRVSPDGKTRTRILFGFGDGSEAVNGVEVDAITGRYYKNPLGDAFPETLRLFVSTFSLDPNTKTGIWEIDPMGIVPPRLVYGAVGGQDVSGYGQGLHGPDALAFNPKPDPTRDPEGKELFVSEFSGGRLWAVNIDSREARLVYDPSVSSDFAMGAAFKFDAAGWIYYGKFSTGQIWRLDPYAGQAPLIVINPAVPVPGIHNIDADEQGNVFVSDIIHGRITVLKFDDNGTMTFRKDVGGESLNLPNGILPLPDGHLAVADLGAIAIVDPDEAKPQADRLTRPWNFLVDNLDLSAGIGMTMSHDLYATAFSRGTLQYLGNLNGLDFNNPPKPHDVLAKQTFAFPADIVGGNSELWVSDMIGVVWHVKLLGPDALSATPLATSFADPTGLAMSADSTKLYVSESMAGQVRIVDPETGALLDVIGDLKEPEGLAFDRCGSLLVVEAEAKPDSKSGHGRLTRIQSDGKHETLSLGLKTHKRGVAVIPQFNFFADVAVVKNLDGTEDAFVTSPEDGSLTRIPLGNCTTP